MFYTRPVLDGLGLDLVKIEGDSSVPSLFTGETSDGGHVHIRYRGGRFSAVYVAPGATQPPRVPPPIAVTIGPWPHGTIFLEQACDLAGLTLHGKRVVLSEEKLRAAQERDWILDWSGRTTYWIRNIGHVSDAGERLFADALRHAFPALILLGEVWRSGGRSYRRYDTVAEFRASLALGIGMAYLGFDPDHRGLTAMLESEKVPLARQAETFAYVVRLGLKGPSPVQPPSADEFGRDIVVGRFPSLHLQAEFITEDPRGKAFIEEFVNIADGCFADVVELVDLKTGMVVDTRAVEFSGSHSVDLRAWCHAAPDRYLGWWRGFSDGDTSFRNVGYRQASITDSTP